MVDNLSGAPIAVLEWCGRVLDGDVVYPPEETDALKRLVCTRGEFGEGMRSVYAHLNSRLSDQELILVIDAAWRCAFIDHTELRNNKRTVACYLLAIENLADELAEKLEGKPGAGFDYFASLVANLTVGENQGAFAPFQDAIELLKLASSDQNAWEREIMPALWRIPHSARYRLLASPAAQLRAMAYRANQIRGLTDNIAPADPIAAAGTRKRKHSDITAFRATFLERCLEDGTSALIQLTPALFARLASAALGRKVNTEAMKQQGKRAKRKQK